MPTSNVVFVTSFFRRHGLAYFDMILRAFAKDPALVPRLMTSDLEEAPGKFSQYALLDAPTDQLPLAQAVLMIPVALEEPWVSTDDWLLEQDRLEASLRREHGERAGPILEWLARQKRTAADETGPLTLDRLLSGWPESVDPHALWQVVHELPLAAQVEWWRKHSPWKDHPQVKLVVVGDSKLWPDNPKGWTKALQTWIKSREESEEHYLVNLFGTATENQLAWYHLAWRSPRLRDSVFCECVTASRSKQKQRFRDIRFSRVSKDLLRELSDDLPTRALTPERKNAGEWLRFYERMGDNFVILVLGARGTGKSSTVRSVFGGSGPTRRYHEVNCAYFADTTMARSALFGHKKGAFTDATSDHEGYFAQANGGALFLDEFHTLAPDIQSLLLTALQTDGLGNYRFTPLGSGRLEVSKFQLILGSNRTIDELRASFPPDFWDRVHQRVVRLPLFDKTTELEDGWNAVWLEMKFKCAANPFDEAALRPRFLEWLRSLDYPGNFRDLQRIAILTADLQRAEQSDLLKGKGGESDPRWFAQLRSQWADDVASARRGAAMRREDRVGEEAVVEAPSSPAAPIIGELDFRADETLTPEIALMRFKNRIVQALIQQFGSMANAARQLKDRGGASASSLSRWRAKRE